MNTFTTLPFAFCWSAQELADAVPQRLSEVYAFAPADNLMPARRAHAPTRRTGYSAAASLRLFHIG